MASTEDKEEVAVKAGYEANGGGFRLERLFLHAASNRMPLAFSRPGRYCEFRLPAEACCQSRRARLVRARRVHTRLIASSFG